MNEIDLKKKFDGFAITLMELSEEVEKLMPELKLQMDKRALSEIVNNLTWAAENSTVIGLHQVGEALDDNMGTGVAN